MEKFDEATSLIEDYFGFDVKTIMIFFGLVTMVVTVVTLIYVSIFGFDNWKTSMEQAGNMMLANFNTPAANVFENGQENIVPDFQNAAPAAGALFPNSQPAGVQYNCSTCGVSGLPMWNAQGTPLCPSCGAMMSMINTW